jgi:hypothetical protein
MDYRPKMNLSQFKNKDFSVEINEFEHHLKKIITKEIPLRDPYISVIHITHQHIQEAYVQFLLIFKRLIEKHSAWMYETFNLEHQFYKILDKLRYTKKPNYAETCEREELASDMKHSIKSELIKSITSKLDELNAEFKKNSSNPPPLLFLMNIHSIYPYIQTKDIISRIINKKGILILIPYLQSKLHHNYEHEPYKDANYNVNTIYLA